MFCSRCGAKKETGVSECPNCGIKPSVQANTSKKNKGNGTKIAIGILIGLVAIGGIIGGIFGVNYLLNANKKLNIQIEDINLDKYPEITAKVRKVEKKSGFSSKNVNIYDANKPIADFTVNEVDGGYEIIYISDEQSMEELRKNLRIENKRDLEDTVQREYIKPKQQHMDILVSQVDSNNFPEVSLYFTAKDEIGNVVRDLKPEDLKLFASSKSGENSSSAVKKLSFVDKKEPVSINMVIDTSGSMDNAIYKCKEMAINFINTIDFSMGDRVEVIEFNDTAKINNYFTSNKESLINSISGLRTTGQTALFDSLIMALHETNTQEGLKCIIAFTDGNDNKSLSNSTDVINLSQKLGIPIYIIGLGNGLENAELSNITNSTMGEYINISNIEQLNNIYNKILKKTKEQYVITYDLSNADESLLKSDISIGINSLNYKGEKYHNFDIKPKEYRVDMKNYQQLKADIKTEAEAKLGSIQGKYSLAFKDIANGDMLSVNSEKIIAASTVKIFIMIEAYDRIHNGSLNGSEVITLSDNMKVGGSGILSTKKAGEKFTVEELINLMMIKSDNTAANILIDKLGRDKINQRIKSLGCINTELNRKMMDQAAIDSGIQNYTSVDDLALVLTKLYNGQCVNKQYDNMMLEIMKNNETKNKIPSKLPSTVTVANKSGEFEGIENDAAIVFTDKGTYILAITTAEGKSGEQVENISEVSKFVYDKYIQSKEQ